jgi:hypothetical protein
MMGSTELAMPSSFTNRIWRWAASVQSIYFLATGLWPILHMKSFLFVTGPKTDLWLVQLFGALICVPAIVLAYSAWRNTFKVETLLIGFLSAFILMAGDVVYVWRGDIGRIYLVDAALEFVLVVGWALAAPRRDAKTQ